ncbi:MAG: tetratricopeptide repeat protein [Pyrinomonadaceae bacterium]
MRLPGVLFLLLILTGGSLDRQALAQAGGHILYGEMKVDESKVTGVKPISYDLILYSLSGQVVGRQRVSSNGSYRFINLADGTYDLVVELENLEVARIRVEMRSPRINTDYRQDISLEWKAPPGAASKPTSVSVEDYYERSSVNQKLFEKAQAATDKKKYGEAAALLNQLLTNDPNDFQAWSELGTLHLVDQNPTEAEKAYVQAIDVRPKFFLALMNLGRLRLMQKNFDGAITSLTTAVEVKPTSAEANYYLGEAYLQIKRGSKAVGYLNAAIRLDPVGKADAHLRLAALYNGAGLKDKAALEYQEFLKKKPDYPEKKKLEQYIAQNKKQ